MELKQNKEPEKKKENSPNITEQWIDKAEAFIDDTADKIHKSDTYKKADQSFEKASKSIFRKAGSLWGNFKNQNDKKDTK